ncbi:hypothetical protein SCREM2_gp95 [Synechococcus phage S-CREM2]|nr:hypothetical protein SCREM2_gp95 [Synechococcus phage S-CREM2]
MQPPEFYCTKYEELFTILFDKLYVLNEEEDEWEPVDWDIIAEDEDMNDHYAWVFGKLKKDIQKAIEDDPSYQLFG